MGFKLQVPLDEFNCGVSLATVANANANVQLDRSTCYRLMTEGNVTYICCFRSLRSLFGVVIVPLAPVSCSLTVSWDLTDAALSLSMEPCRTAPYMLSLFGVRSRSVRLGII